jgi:hypothetical protein
MFKAPGDNQLNILVVLVGALRRCRPLAGSGHVTRPASKGFIY